MKARKTPTSARKKPPVKRRSVTKTRSTAKRNPASAPSPTDDAGWHHYAASGARLTDSADRVAEGRRSDELSRRWRDLNRKVFAAWLAAAPVARAARRATAQNKAGEPGWKHVIGDWVRAEQGDAEALQRIADGPPGELERLRRATPGYARVADEMAWWNRGGEHWWLNHPPTPPRGNPRRTAKKASAKRQAAKARPARKPAHRRNPGLEEAPLSDFKPRNADEAKAVKKHAKVYKDYHWGAPAGKVFRINDSLIPHLTAMGKLNQLSIGNGIGTIDFPEGCWVAWDPAHPRKRLYLVVTPDVREKFRNAIKHAKKTEPIQAIANRAGGEQARYKLPAIQGVELGPIESIVYTTWKKGDDDDKGGCGYIHEFGGDGLSGYLPVLAVDVSGRLWVCAGSYKTAEAGVTG